MNRRAFLGWLAGTAAGVALAPTLDLDQLLWTRGEKTHFDIQRPSGLWVSEALSVGDIFTIDGHYAVNPMTVVPLGFLQQFVITSSVSAGAVNEDAIWPPIVTRGLYTTVDRRLPRNKVATLRPMYSA